MKLEMMQNKKTVIASAGMHPYAFVKATKLADSLGAIASTTEDGKFKADFKSVKVAKQFVTEWTAQYEQALANKQAKDEPKAEKQSKKAPSGKGKSKPKPAKGNAKMTKKEVRSWAWKQADGDRAKYDELCKSKGVDNHR